MEKAHPDVFNVLLQVLDDGRITDSHGHTVDFKNTILIMTSNLGSTFLLEGIDPASGDITSQAREQVEQLLRQSFRPEFLNRLDEIVFYKPLTKDEISKIVDLMIQDLSARMKEQQLSVTLAEEARRYIVDEGYDPVYGARPRAALSSACGDEDRPQDHRGICQSRNLSHSGLRWDIPLYPISLHPPL